MGRSASGSSSVVGSPHRQVATPAPDTAAPLTYLKSCKAGYRKAIIGGAQKCLHGGQFCAKSRASEYRRYGFVCNPGSDGRYRLFRR